MMMAGQRFFTGITKDLYQKVEKIITNTENLTDENLKNTV